MNPTPNTPSIEKLMARNYNVKVITSTNNQRFLFVPKLGLTQIIETSFEKSWQELESKKKKYFIDMLELGSAHEIPLPENESLTEKLTKPWVKITVVLTAFAAILTLGVLGFSVIAKKNVDRLIKHINYVMEPEKINKPVQEQKFRTQLENFRPYYREFRKFLKEEDLHEKTQK